MISTLVAALTLTSSLLLEVPYLPQSDDLCGGAALAMIYRYWGDTHAQVKQFASLVDRRAGGIADSVLVEAVTNRGWTATRFTGSIERLRTHLDAGQPVIVLIADHRERFHYVVVIGATPDRIVIHDPSWGPARSMANADFVRLWKGTRFWSLLVLPVEGPHEEPERAASVAAPPATTCESLLADAIESVGHLGLASADRILAGVRAECPDASGPLRELAGVRFAQRRWSEAGALARQALSLGPGDSYAWDVLGSSLFMQNDSIGALRAWNRIDRPQLDTIRIDGLRRARYQFVVDALRLEPGEVLTAEAFKRSRHLLNELPDRDAARLSLRPGEDGVAGVDVVLQERSVLPRGAAEWAAASARTAVDREVLIAVPGTTGQGEVWTATWRWWAERPRVGLSLAAPRGGSMPGVWLVDGSWEVQTYAPAGTAAAERVRESRAHGSVSFGGWTTRDLRYEFSGGIDSWNGTQRNASVGASLDRRSVDDRVSIGVAGTYWIPLSGDRAFSSLGVHGHLRAPSEVTRWDYRVTTGFERASDTAPLAIWSGAGDGRARAPLLRAHPLLSGGVIDGGPGSSFGRTTLFGSIETRRWFERPRVPRIGLATFSDIARASRSFASGSQINLDVGAGIRVRVPGWAGALRVDVAHGVRDSRDAVTFGWAF